MPNDMLSALVRLNLQQQVRRVEIDAPGARQVLGDQSRFQLGDDAVALTVQQQYRRLDLR